MKWKEDSFFSSATVPDKVFHLVGAAFFQGLTFIVMFAILKVIAVGNETPETFFVLSIVTGSLVTFAGGLFYETVVQGNLSPKDVVANVVGQVLASGILFVAFLVGRGV